jgi:hypothetical protein
MTDLSFYCREETKFCWVYVCRRGAYRALVGKPEGRRPLGRTSVDGRIILKWTCERLDGGAWTGAIWLWIGTGGELL